MEMKKESLVDIENIKIHGRYSGDLNPLTLFWAASGIEVNFLGSELWIELECECENEEIYLCVLFNDDLITRQMLLGGKHRICVARNLKEVTNIKIFKDNQAKKDDTQQLKIYSLISDGGFLPLDKNNLKIEFIGDSITCGSGAIGSEYAPSSDIPSLFITPYASAYYSFGHILSKYFGADYNLISQGGFGVRYDGQGNKLRSIPPYYKQVAGIFNHEIAKEEYEFLLFTPDIVIINLGTNDEKALTYADMQNFINDIHNFLKLVRGKNPKAYIVWCYGMMRNSITEILDKTISMYKKQTGDMRISFIDLECCKQKEIGSYKHPSKQTHTQTAKHLADFIEKNIL